MKKQKKCLRCKYEWMSRVKDPVQCPRCKRYDWNKEINVSFEHIKNCKTVGDVIKLNEEVKK